jgi:hypothetical protein
VTKAYQRGRRLADERKLFNYLKKKKGSSVP